jgi:hypothetical protein
VLDVRRAHAELVDARLTRYHGPGPRHPGLRATASALEDWAERRRHWELVCEGVRDLLDRAEAPVPVVLAPWAEPLATWSDERRDEYLARLSRAEGITIEEARRRWVEVVSG